MFELRNHRGLFVAISLILLISACGPSTQQDSTISTAVAQTVQAGQSLTEIASLPTNTPEPTPILDVTPTMALTPTTSTPIPQVGAFCENSASWVGETIPDGTIIRPGETFTKVWQIKNTGKCTWDATWQLIFYSGDQMDGLASYNFPEPAEPGETLSIPILLRAPAGGGTYTGEWKMKSPWGESFGVGQYSAPITVSILVGSGTPENKRTETVYGVTAVTYQVDRQCTAANTVYKIVANISTSGPAEVIFTWVQSDGNNRLNNRISFTEASTKSRDREWIQHSLNSSPNQRWVQVVITSPSYQEFDPVLLPKLCGQQ